MEQRRPKRGQGALNEALEVDPVAAAVLGSVGLQYDIPIHTGSFGLITQSSKQKSVKVDSLQRGGFCTRCAEAME
jgi:hypothetical protein